MKSIIQKKLEKYANIITPIDRGRINVTIQKAIEEAEKRIDIWMKDRPEDIKFLKRTLNDCFGVGK